MLKSDRNYTCSKCKRVFNKAEYEITKKKDSCILHLKEIDKDNKNPNIYNKAFDEYIKIHLKNKNIQFSDITFLECFDKSKYRNFKGVHFQLCRFYTNLYFANSEKVFYENCDFYIRWNNINYKNLFTPRKYLFNLCTFHEEIRSKVLYHGRVIYDSKIFQKCTFKNDIKFSKGLFNEKIFKDCNFDNNIKLEIEDSDIKKRFEISKNNIFRLLNFKDSIFLEKVKIKRCHVENANFSNTTFHELADFYKTEFKKVDFDKTDFEKISVFSECEFNCDVDFKHTKFLGKTLFQDTVIKGKLNLRNSIFDDEVNFLDITSMQREIKDGQFIGEPSDIEVANRETARIIKHFYDSTNNVIEANRFYKLEMKKREEELKKADKVKISEWLIFKIHGLTSNHSQDWLLALFWILSLSFGLAFVNCVNEYLDTKLEYILIDTLVYSIVIILSVFIVQKEKINNFFLIGLFYLIYGLTTKDFTLYNIVNDINPFSIMTEFSELTFLTLVYKVTIAYLIYQLIVSIRQNTRRK